MKTIYWLAFSRLKYNKGRSLLSIIAIALMTTLLMTIGSSSFTFIRYQQMETEQNAVNKGKRCLYRNPKAERLFELRSVKKGEYQTSCIKRGENAFKSQ